MEFYPPPPPTPAPGFFHFNQLFNKTVSKWMVEDTRVPEKKTPCNFQQAKLDSEAL